MLNLLEKTDIGNLAIIINSLSVSPLVLQTIDSAENRLSDLLRLFLPQIGLEITRSTQQGNWLFWIRAELGQRFIELLTLPPEKFMNTEVAVEMKRILSTQN